MFVVLRSSEDCPAPSGSHWNSAPSGCRSCSCLCPSSHQKSRWHRQVTHSLLRRLRWKILVDPWHVLLNRIYSRKRLGVEQLVESVSYSRSLRCCRRTQNRSQRQKVGSPRLHNPDLRGVLPLQVEITSTILRPISATPTFVSNPTASFSLSQVLLNFAVNYIIRCFEVQ